MRDTKHEHEVEASPPVDPTNAVPPAPVTSPDPTRHAPRYRDGTRWLRPDHRSPISDATLAADIVVADGLPLERLHARVDAIAAGRAAGDITAANRWVVERLVSNQRRAEALGWTRFMLERVGDSGRLELTGMRAPGQSRELVPDAFPYDLAEALDLVRALEPGEHEP